MSISLKLSAIAGALVLALGTASANENPATPSFGTSAATTNMAAAASDRPLFANPFDASTWYDGAEGMDHAEMGKPEDFNMAHPKFWLSFIDPKTHTKRHMQFTNPATYAQFMDPGFYMNFANPMNWLAWMNPANYGVLVELETYAYWMQPGAYMHIVEPHGYMQSMDLNNYAAYWNPATYMKWMDPSEYNVTEATEGLEKTMDALNPANVFGYMTSMLSTDN